MLFNPDTAPGGGTYYFRDFEAAARSPSQRRYEMPIGCRTRLRCAPSNTSGTLTVGNGTPSLAMEELRRHRVKQAEELLRLDIRQSEESMFACSRTMSPGRRETYPVPSSNSSRRRDDIRRLPEICATRRLRQAAIAGHLAIL